MERDFRYLRDEHGDAGARDIFERICTQLLHARYGDKTHNIRVNRGDEGIDILVGDFRTPIDNYQCKFFLDGIGDSQKSQIRESFKTAINAQDYKMKKWILCVPCNLSAKEFKWWSEWSGQQHKIYEIDISLFDGSYLISSLKEYNLYEREFDIDIRNKLDKILNSFNEEKVRIASEIIMIIEDVDRDMYNGMMFVKKLENANIDLVEGCKQDFFNAEFAEYIIKSKGDPELLRLFNNLKSKIYSFWETQYRMYQNDNDGNELLTRVYERIEDSDTTTLNCPQLPEISLMAKKGMLHQWAEECSIGWLKDYKQRLEEYLLREGA